MKEAEQSKAVLIVMGSHGRSVLAAKFLGYRLWCNPQGYKNPCPCGKEVMHSALLTRDPNVRLLIWEWTDSLFANMWCLHNC